MKTWDDIAKQIPNTAPDDFYDKARNDFYKTQIAPKIQPGEDPVATYNEFLKRTDRTGLKVGRAIGHGMALTLAAELPAGAVGAAVEAFGLPGAVAKVAAGGAAWASYNAFEAKEGDRVAAGLKGAAAGALIETGIGALLGFGEKAMVDVAHDAIADPATVTKEANKVVSQTVVDTVKEARAKGYTTGPIVIDPSLKGLRVITRDAEDMPTIHQVVKGRESETIGKVEEILANGGAIDGVHAHPQSQSRAVEFMKHFAQKAESEDQVLRMNVLKGKAGEVAKELNKYGLRGTVVDDSTVSVGPEAPWMKARNARALKQAADDWVTGGGTAPELTDQTGKDLFRIGELRNKIENPEIPTTRADHQELHHLQGDVGARHQLANRTDIGKLGLRYFEQTVKGDTPDATAMIERYVKKGAPRLEEGARPPVGNRADLASGTLQGFRAPTSERVEWDTDPLETPGEVRVRPSGVTKRAEGTSQKLGWTGAQITGQSGPMRVLSADATAADIYHEAIHDGLQHAGLHEDIPKLLKGENETAQGIMDGLRKNFWGYAIRSDETVANEAFTHAAEAIRMGDQAKLDELARWDTSVDNVKRMVNTTAGRAWEGSLKSDTAPVRAFQRRMLDLVRRTSPDVSHELAGAQKFGYTTWFDPELGQFVMRDGEGRELLKPDLNAVWDHIDDADPSAHFPDVAHKAYFRNVNGPIVPRGTEPVDGTATLEWDGPPVNFGAQAIASVSRPTLDWAASIQNKLTKYGVDVDFYGAVKDIDDAGRQAGPLLDNLKGEFAGVLKGVPEARRVDYGEVLRLPETQWQETADKLGLNTADMANLRALKEMDQRNVATGGTSFVDALSELHDIRANGGVRGLGRKSAVTDAVNNGQLGYSSLNVGHVGAWAMRNTIDTLHMSEPLKALETLAKTKTTSGELLFKQIQWPIRNYINYMKGIPDASQSLLNSFVSGMTEAAGKRIAQFNKVLPKALQLPTDFGPPKALMAKFQLLQYTAGLGARPAVFIRDTFQAMQAAAIMGPTAFAEGLAKALTPEGRALADAAGAMIHGRNVSEMLGDVTKDLPASSRVSDFAVKMADRLMAPSRMGHNIGRTIAFLGEYTRALREISKFRAGEMGADAAKELAHATGAWFQDAAPMQRLLDLASNKAIPVEDAAKAFGLAMNDATQFALRSGTQGAGLRTGLGRVFGQYGTWPMNYIEFVRKLTTRAFENPVKGVPALAGWAAMNYGAFAAAQNLGIDAGKWLFFSPAGYAGSPNLELLQNIMTAPEESAAGLDARRKLHEVPFEFLPAGVEINSIMKAIDGGETNIPQLLGFKPLKDQQEKDFEDWLLTETGYTGKSKTEIEDFFNQ